MPKRRKKPRQSPAYCRGVGLPESQGAEAEERMAVETQKLLMRLSMKQNVVAREVEARNPNAPPKMVAVMMPPLRRRPRAPAPSAA